MLQVLQTRLSVLQVLQVLQTLLEALQVLQARRRERHACAQEGSVDDAREYSGECREGKQCGCCLLSRSSPCPMSE